MARKSKRSIRQNVNYGSGERQKPVQRNSAAQDKFGYFNEARKFNVSPLTGNRTDQVQQSGGIVFNARSARRDNNGKVLNMTNTLAHERTAGDIAEERVRDAAILRARAELKAARPDLYLSEAEVKANVKNQVLQQLGITEAQLMNRNDRGRRLNYISKKTRQTLADNRRRAKEIFDEYYTRSRDVLVKDLEQKDMIER